MVFCNEYKNSMIAKYKNEIIPKLKEEFNLKNDLSLPFLEKIVLNMGLAESLTNKDTLEKAMEQLAAISGQKPKFTKAKKSISSFKLREGDKIGAMVTLRGQRAWYFLEKLIAIVSPRIRDFRGVDESKFDKLGNYSMGISEQIIFPEINYSQVDKIRGMVITLVFKNSNPEKSKKLLELLGLPFKKNN